MSVASNLVRRFGQLTVGSTSASAVASTSTSSLRSISTTAVQAAEAASGDGARASSSQPSSSSSSPPPQRRSPSGSSSGFSRRNTNRAGPAGARSAERRPRDGDAGAGAGAGDRRGPGGRRPLGGRYTGPNGKPRRPPQRRSAFAGDALNIYADTTYVDWYHGAGSRAFAETPQGRGPFWIARTPFPMNPSFLPPPPVSQKYRQAMWDLHIQDPQKYNLRFLSQHFGLTLERAHAVLRLKALEAEMTARAQPLQRDFESNMERLIGSNPADPPRVREDITRSDKAKDVDAESEDVASRSDVSRETLARRRDHEPDIIGTRRGIGATLDNRGPLTEDVTPESAAAASSSSSSSSPSVILAALEQEQSKAGKKAMSTPVGGPDLAYLKRSGATPQSSIRPSERKPHRSVMTVLDLKDARQDVNYIGEGHLAQNRRRAEKRQRAVRVKAAAAAATAAKRKAARMSRQKKPAAVGANSKSRHDRVQKKVVQSKAAKVQGGP